MWHTLLFGGTAAIFLAMTASALFHLRWARRLPSLGEVDPAHQPRSSRGNQAPADPCAGVHGQSANRPRAPGKSEMTPAPVARSSLPLVGPGVDSLPLIGASGTLSVCGSGVLCSVVLAARDEEA